MRLLQARTERMNLDMQTLRMERELKAYGELLLLCKPCNTAQGLCN